MTRSLDRPPPAQPKRFSCLAFEADAYASRSGDTKRGPINRFDAAHQAVDDFIYGPNVTRKPMLGAIVS